MTLISDDCNHFMTWLAAERRALSPGTATLRGDLFPERAIFGQYVSEQLAPYLASGAIRHLQAVAVSARASAGRYAIDLSDDTSLDADLDRAGDEPPQAEPAAGAAPASPARNRLVADPYDNARVARSPPTDRVLIVGTGLTSADVIASLYRRGFWGEITAISRRGLRSRGHAAAPRKGEADFATEPAPTARLLLRRIREAVAADAAQGFSWHATLDRMREHGQAAWAALDTRERARLVRHLRVFWDVHRFRIAPQVEAVLEAQTARGTLRHLAAQLVRAEETDDGIEVEIRAARPDRDRDRLLRLRRGHHRPLARRRAPHQPGAARAGRRGPAAARPARPRPPRRRPLPRGRHLGCRLADALRHRAAGARPCRRADGRPRGHRACRSGGADDPRPAAGSRGAAALRDAGLTPMSDAKAISIPRAGFGRPLLARPRLGRAWIGWVLPAALLLLWEAGVRPGLISGNVLPAPTAVVAAVLAAAAVGRAHPQHLGQHLAGARRASPSAARSASGSASPTACRG